MKKKSNPNFYIELINDPEMYMMFENMSRGGISYSFTRHAIANNKYM